MTRLEATQGVSPEAGSFFVLERGDQTSAGLLLKNLEAGDGEAVFVGLGRSMEPFLFAGDWVRVVRTAGFVRTGWVVVFPWRGGIVTHRVIRVKGSVFWARGDSCADAEGPVPVSEAIGRVVAYRRDGRWHSLDSKRQSAVGLVVNTLYSGMRRIARRWPRLRRIVEVDLLGMRPTRKIYSRVGRWVYGDVSVERDSSPERAIDALVSRETPLSQKLVKDAEELLLQKHLRLFVARSSKRGCIGRLLLLRPELGEYGSTGCVSGFLISPGARGLGVGGMLLLAVEGAARGDGVRRLLALVEAGNVRSMKVFLEAGYRRVNEWDLAGRSGEERELVPEGRILLEKML